MSVQAGIRRESEEEREQKALLKAFAGTVHHFLGGVASDFRRSF